MIVPKLRFNPAYTRNISKNLLLLNSEVLYDSMLLGFEYYGADNGTVNFYVTLFIIFEIKEIIY